MTTQVPPAAAGASSVAASVMKTEVLQDDEEEDGEEMEEGEGDEGEEMDGEGSPTNTTGDGELFDYIYGSESNDNYVMGE